MNFNNEFTQRQRFEKNKKKQRVHETRIESASTILHGINEQNKKSRRAFKNFKRSARVERDPFIELWRCNPDNEEIDDWGEWVNE